MAITYLTSVWQTFQQGSMFFVPGMGIMHIPAILILESSPKTARLWRAVFGLQSGEFAHFGRELSALKLILRIAVHIPLKRKIPSPDPSFNNLPFLLRRAAQPLFSKGMAGYFVWLAMA